MSESAAPSESQAPGRGRGHGKSRGGLGKYLRASGRGRGRRGRPAEFTQRLVLEGEEEGEEDEEEAAERQAKYSRRQLGSNVDRYKEPEPELDSDGEPIVEPEVDLSIFLEKQRLTDNAGPFVPSQAEELDDDIDHELDSKFNTAKTNLKGKAQQMEWDDSFEDLLQEKASADAARDLKNRFRAKSQKLRTSKATPASARNKNKDLSSYIDAPPLPLSEDAKPKTEMEEMEDYLDELLK